MVFQRFFVLMVAFSLIFPVPPLFTQERDYGIPDELMGDFRRQRIKIETTTARRIRYTQVREDVLWEAMRGFEALEEIEFYNLTGYEELAQKVLKRDKKNRNIDITTWSLYGLSALSVVMGILIGTSVIDLVPDGSGSFSSTNILIGVGSVAFGSLSYWVGWYVNTGIDDTQAVRSDTAIDIADEYNQKLAGTIMEVSEEATPVSFSQSLSRYSYLPKLRTVR